MTARPLWIGSTILVLCLWSWVFPRAAHAEADTAALLAQPLTLPQCLQLAAHNAPAAALLEARVKQALGVARQTAAWPNPIATYTAQDIGLTLDGHSELLHQATLTYPLLFAFTRSLEAAAARAASLAAAADRDDALRLLGLTVASGYYDLLLQEDQATLEAQAVAVATELAAVTERRQRAGDIAVLEVSRAQAEVLDARRRHDLAERNLDLARRALSILLGAERPMPIQLVRGPAELPREIAALLPDPLATAGEPTPALVASLVEHALGHRPDLRRNQAVLEQAELTSRLERRRTIPLADLQITAGARIQQLGTGGIVSVNAPLPIFNLNAGNRMRASAQRSAAQATFTLLRQQITLQVESALRTWLQSERALRDYARPLVALREPAARTAERLFREGVLSYVEVVTAQRELLDARRTLALAEHDAALARQQLVATLAAY